MRVQQGVRNTVLVALLAATSVQAAPVKSSAADKQLQNDAISAGLSLAGDARTAVETYWREQKRLPSNNAEAHLGVPASYASGPIRRLDIEGAGRVRVTLSAASGVDGGVILLVPTPSSSADSYAIDWACTTPSYSDIHDATNGTCDYSVTTR